MKEGLTMLHGISECLYSCQTSRPLGVLEQVYNTGNYADYGTVKPL
jgi:hypothetical protein